MRRQIQQSSSGIIRMFLVLMTFLTSTVAWTTTTTTTSTPFKVNNIHQNKKIPLFSRLGMASTEASTSSSSPPQLLTSFDTYQPGITTDVCWKDNNINSNINNNAYTANEKDVCVVSYVGTIMSTGFVFNRNDEFVFQIGSGKSMPGFDTGCIGMSEQTIRTIRVPPNRAYGVKGTYDGRVPPNADLEFVITMKRLVPYEQNPILAELALFGELRLIGLLGCVAVLALPPFFQ